MTSLFRLSAWLPAAFVLSAHAQSLAPVSPNHSDNPSDAAFAAPAPAYQSAFDGYRPSSVPAHPTEETWRAANEAVGNQSAHGEHMQMAPPASPASPAASHDHHTGHDMSGHQHGGAQ